MTDERLENVIGYANGLSSRIDYLEDELTTLRETIERLENEIRSLKNPFSKARR